jgi:hypothetical protein
MFRWLNTQGQNFLNPLPGSTNYMGAYNREGKLNRVAKSQKTDKSGEKSEANDTGESKEGGEELPPEWPSDMRPFRFNPAFRSEAVLSEELREEIWKRVMKQGQSVREVSANLDVEMSRVGAVVRLMEIEKEWQRIVSFFYAAPVCNTPV